MLIQKRYILKGLSIQHPILNKISSYRLSRLIILCNKLLSNPLTRYLPKHILVWFVEWRISKLALPNELILAEYVEEYAEDKPVEHQT